MSSFVVSIIYIICYRVSEYLKVQLSLIVGPVYRFGCQIRFPKYNIHPNFQYIYSKGRMDNEYTHLYNDKYNALISSYISRIYQNS